MSRIERFVARLTLVVISIVIIFILVEVGANYWLWNFATVDEFNAYASVNQIRSRYGDDIAVFEQDGNSRSHSPHHYLGYLKAPNFQRGENKHNRVGFRGGDVSLEKPEDTFRIGEW